MSAVKKVKKFLTRLLMLTSRSTRSSQRNSSMNSGSGSDPGTSAGSVVALVTNETTGIGQPSVVHALVVIFLEFFAWGLLTIPNINALNRSFPQHAFLMNGLIMGVKGFLSFLSAPLVGTLSDTWGRKTFLLLTVFFTCMPIPFMALAPADWYFVVVAISGLFGVTFSVIFAFVADVTDESERSSAYGLVSATFAASLVTSPALGAYMTETYGDNSVVALASAVALLDFLFILFVVPESLPKKLRITPTLGGPPSTPTVPSSSSAGFDWERLDPFQSLKKVGSDRTVMITSLTVFLSYLPEAGQYSCIFVYLRLVIGFSAEQVSIFLAVIGLLSVLAQTIVLSILMKKLGSRQTILVGLFFQALQLAWFGMGREVWMMYAAGILAALSSITYPAISAHVSNYASHDQQGLAQGVLTGVRGLCNGFGPALYGCIFYMFHVDLTDTMPAASPPSASSSSSSPSKNHYHKFINMRGHGITSATTTTQRPRQPFLFQFGRDINNNSLLMPGGNNISVNNSTIFNSMLSNNSEIHNAGGVPLLIPAAAVNGSIPVILPPSPNAIPGPAFVVGAMLVLLAMAAASFMPDVLDSLTRGQLYSALSRYSSVREFDFDHDDRGSSAGAEKNEIIFYAAAGRALGAVRKKPNSIKKKSRKANDKKSEPRIHLQRAYKSVNNDRHNTNLHRQRRRSSDAENYEDDDDDDFDEYSTHSSSNTMNADGLSLNEEVFYADEDNKSVVVAGGTNGVSLYNENGDDDDVNGREGDCKIPHASSSTLLNADALASGSRRSVNLVHYPSSFLREPHVRIQFGGSAGAARQTSSRM